MVFQAFLLSLGMGKRLTPEEREARIKAYEEAKAAKAAARQEKRLARIKAYEERKAKREQEKKGPKPVNCPETSKVGYVKSLPPFRGQVNVGDEVGFRFLGMAMSGKVVSHTKEADYHDTNLEEGQVSRRGIQEFYTVKGFDGTFYPIRRNSIFCKKVNNEWKEQA